VKIGFVGLGNMGGRLASRLAGVCVRTGEQVRECADALLPAMPEGSMLMIHSTISPDLVLTLAQEGAARGVEVIDAPVTVTRYGVQDGPFVCTMIGAGETDTERVRPLSRSPWPRRLSASQPWPASRPRH
jgi:3-hydroxyisobutyrate dehydrogenase